MVDPPFSDPTTVSRWRPLRLLQSEIDAEIARVYAEGGISGIKPSWVLELLRLRSLGPSTITELARSVRLTHSAISQKVSAMRAAGLVVTSPGADARSKRVALTPRSLQLVDRLAAEWRATEATLSDIESEIPYPLSRVVEDIERLLQQRSFHDRLTSRLAADDAWR